MNNKINQEKMNKRRCTDKLYITIQSYTLSDEQYKGLSFGLDTHIPVKVNKNASYTEFEVFLSKFIEGHISNIPENELRQIKTNLRNTCDKCTKIKGPYKYRKDVKELSERRDIAISKTDKGRGVVIMNRDKYTKKCLQILNTNQFIKLNSDPTKATERKLQNVLRKIKSKFSPNEYKQLYPTGSSPDKFYETAKIHKLSQGDQLEKFPIRQIISNINTATYRVAIATCETAC